MNLLAETLKDIEQSGHDIKDIIFIGAEDSGHCCSWDEFKAMADIDYDWGFGSQEIATDLIIVFSDGSKMWRHEYDGSENWDYSSPFKMPTEKLEITRLTYDGCMWENLSAINKL